MGANVIPATEFKTKDTNVIAGEAAPLRTLIVEDEPVDALLIERTLARVEGFAFQSLRASDLGTAQAAVRESEFDIAFIDFDLAGSCGVDLIPQLTAGSPCAPILVTGNLTKDVHTQAIQAGVLATLSKDHLHAKGVEIAVREALCNLGRTQRNTTTKDVPPMRNATSEQDLAAVLPEHMQASLQYIVAQAALLESRLKRDDAEPGLVSEARALRFLADELSTFCDDTLAVFGRTAAGSTSRVDLQSIILDVVRLAEPLRARKGVQLNFRLLEFPLYVSVEEDLARYVLIDLLTTAMERVLSGGEISVDIRIDDEQAQLHFASSSTFLRSPAFCLRDDRVVARATAILERFGASIVFRQKVRRGESIVEVRFPRCAEQITYA